MQASTKPNPRRGEALFYGITGWKFFPGVISALHAKIMAIHFGLEVVKQMKYCAQYMESDSMLLYQRD